MISYLLLSCNRDLAICFEMLLFKTYKNVLNCLYEAVRLLGAQMSRADTMDFKCFWQGEKQCDSHFLFFWFKLQALTSFPFPVSLHLYWLSKLPTLFVNSFLPIPRVHVKS